MTLAPPPVVGAPMVRVEAREKVTGAAVYASEQPSGDLAYAWIVQATIARGTITRIDASAAGALHVLTHENAPPVRQADEGDLAVLQSPRVAYRGQVVALVVAETLDAAREAAGNVVVEYDAEPHDVLLTADHPKLRPSSEFFFPADSLLGDFDAAFASAHVQVDATYTTPALHNNPMEPHATLAYWDGGQLTIYDATQGTSGARDTLAHALNIAPELVRVICPHVGGAFGCKGTPRPNAVLAALAAQLAGRPVKLAVTRRQMFALTGYRTPTIQRVRLAAGADGRLTAIGHDAVDQTSTVIDSSENAAEVTRMMYAAPNRRTTHLTAALDVPSPSWMNAPGECPGMYATESALDELAVECAIDPVELRIRNDSDVHPESGKRWSSRNLVACLREGAERFGWAGRDPKPGVRRDGRFLFGTGVASSVYPSYLLPAQATARVEPDGRYTVEVSAADLGTGARTVLTQIAADALEVAPERVDVRIGDSALPPAGAAGGSSGTASWGSAITGACERLRESGDDEASYDSTDDIERLESFARAAFGAQFAEVRVDTLSGEVRVERMLGVFAGGRIINPRTARSQLTGGMIMGMSMALFEETGIDAEFGDFLDADLAQYHVAVNADVRAIEAHFIDERDPHVNAIGVKGIGELGIVGTAAAVGNAVYHATGVRFRSLPLRPDRILAAL